MRAGTLLSLLLLAGLASWLAQPAAGRMTPTAVEAAASCLQHDCGCAPEGCADSCCCTAGAAPVARGAQAGSGGRERAGAVIVAGSCRGPAPDQFAFSWHDPGLPAGDSAPVTAKPAAAPAPAPDAGLELLANAQMPRRRPPRRFLYSIR